MKIKLVGILICMLMISSTTTFASTQVNRDTQQTKNQFFDTTSMLLPMKTFGGINDDNSWSIQQFIDRKSIMGFETNNGWYSGSISGPDLWHQTSVDSCSGNNSMGCFNISTLTYRNNMNFNYLIINETFSTEGAIEMIMDYYSKYITENSNDYWGIVLYDPSKKLFFDFGELSGFQPNWTHYIFNIKSAYDYCYQQGAFRNNDGSRSYDFRIGFVFIITDSSGITNPEAEAQGVFWSGIFIDDVTISRLDTNDPPNTPVVPSGLNVGVVGQSYEYSTVTTDPEGDTITYGWDWDEDGIIDEWTGFYP